MIYYFNKRDGQGSPGTYNRPDMYRTEFDTHINSDDDSSKNSRLSQNSVPKSNKTHPPPPDVIVLVSALNVLTTENAELKQRKTSPLPE